MQWWVFVLGTVLTVVFGVMLVTGGRLYWRVQKLLFLLAGALLVWLVSSLSRAGTFRRAGTGSRRRPAG